MSGTSGDGHLVLVELEASVRASIVEIRLLYARKHEEAAASKNSRLREVRQDLQGISRLE